MIGLLLVVAAMMMMLRNRRQRSNAPRPTVAEQVEQYRQERGVRADLESLMVEIEQLAKRLASQLDAKAIRLESLIQAADQKIVEITRISQSAATYPPPPAPAERHGRDEPTREAHAADGPPRVNGGEDHLARSVYRLADQGVNADEIATRLKEHVGKVELILALRKV
ncbi:MAG: hypothetical protein IT443_00450 [Phycisphaeraceae bacterium]|nr:hypothetical protein [Phycisphaeraceae bacterium]